MSPFPFLQRANLAEDGRRLHLTVYRPLLALKGLQTGIDNVRTDVYLSPKFSITARAIIARLLARFGDVEDLTGDAPVGRSRVPSPQAEQKSRAADLSEFKAIATELLIAALNKAKSQSNVSLDLLARLAVIKFLQAETTLQFNVVLERCRAKMAAYEGPLQANAASTIALRERISTYQVSKRVLVRRVGQELFQLLNDLEWESLSRMRRSLLGEGDSPAYNLFQNRLLFTEDGRDDFVSAEHYVMLGNFERDPDRLQPVLQIARQFLASAGIGEVEGSYDELLSAPDNAQEIVACGAPDTRTKQGKAQERLLSAWTELLEREGVLDQVIAAYEVANLLPEYSPPVNPQQLKQALIWREERKRVEQLLEQHGKLQPTNFHAAIKRVASCRVTDRERVAGRFMRDLMCYYHDLRAMEVVREAMDGINLIASEKLRELSAINRSLYEILLPEESKPEEQRVVGHVILKADIRDSSTLTRTLFQRGLNPASYFSLNFYEPINKLLPKYDATKLFIEGDAVILALFEHEGERASAVARACVMACEMIEIVRAYNRKSEEAGLPRLELGIGICYQDSAPMYLVDGTQQIMISPALNQSDRLSSCSKGARKLFDRAESLFNVYCFQSIDDADTGGQPDEFLMRYNVGGINLSEAAFRKLRQEISLELSEAELPSLWDEGPVRLYGGMVAIGPGFFHTLVVREAGIPHVASQTLELKKWTDRRYYEVCTNEVVREFAKMRSANARGAGR